MIERLLADPDYSSLRSIRFNIGIFVGTNDSPFIRLPSTIQTVRIDGEATCISFFLRCISARVEKLVLRYHFQSLSTRANADFERWSKGLSVFEFLENLWSAGPTNHVSIQATHLCIVRALRQYSRMSACIHSSKKLSALWQSCVNRILSHFVEVGAETLTCRSFCGLLPSQYSKTVLNAICERLVRFRTTVSHSDEFCFSILRRRPKMLKSLVVSSDTSLDNSNSLYYGVWDLAEHCCSLERLWFDTDSFGANLVHICDKPGLRSRLTHLGITYFDPWSRWCVSPIAMPRLELLHIAWFPLFANGPIASLPSSLCAKKDKIVQLLFDFFVPSPLCRVQVDMNDEMHRDFLQFYDTE